MPKPTSNEASHASQATNQSSKDKSKNTKKRSKEKVELSNLNKSLIVKEKAPKDSSKAKSKSSTQQSAYHVLSAEADMPKATIMHIFKISELLRQVNNELVGITRKRLNKLFYNTNYFKLLKQLKQAKDNKQEETEKELKEKINKLKQECLVTEKDCIDTMKEIKERYVLNAHFAQACAESVWQGVETILYGKGKNLHYKNSDKYPSLRACSINKDIPLKVQNDKLVLSIENRNDKLRIKRLKEAEQAQSMAPKDDANCDSLGTSAPSKKPKNISKKCARCVFGIKIRDRFAYDEIQAIMYYLQHTEEVKRWAMESRLNSDKEINTFRPCFVALVPKIIRGRKRVFVNICIEGNPVPKIKGGKNQSYEAIYTNGNPVPQLIGSERKHTYGEGPVGVDIGTQSLAYNSKSEVNLVNLAEHLFKSSSQLRHERKFGSWLWEMAGKIGRVQRKMERSLRANNPDNYDENGKLKKAPKQWVYSKNYEKLHKRLIKLNRKLETTTKIIHNETVNHLRSLGDILITEPSIAARAAKRSKNKNHKRFGKSIRYRSSGYFYEQAIRKFKATGGQVHVVDNTYKASQYDHTSDKYIKKKLSDRMFRLADGTKVQRDLYSSFLLYCCDTSDPKNLKIDKQRCRQEFAAQLKKERNVIGNIKSRKLKICNSGVKV